MAGRTKTCTDCNESLPLSKFYVVGGKVQDVCKVCFYMKKQKSKMWGWRERFATFCAPTLEDVEKCRIAHEMLMEEIRASRKRSPQ